MTDVAIDETKVEEFVGQVLGDLGGATACALAFLGDQLGLFRDLAEHGPASSDTLAERTGLDERYVREWLGGMTNAGYLDHDAAVGVWSLPPERAAVLATEATPVSLSGVFQMLLGRGAAFSVLPDVAERFRTSGGVPQSRYGDDFWQAMHRTTAGWHEGLLVPVWLAAMPEVREKLERGCTMADVGCGWGRALVTLARTFPTSTFVGYDVHGPSIEAATAAARDAGVDDRVRFGQLNAADGLPERYDVISTFDVVHDAIDPAGLLQGIHDALTPDGRFVCLEVNCSPDLGDMNGPLGALWHTISLTYCMTTSLAGGGAGLGTVGLHEAKLREMCAAAGFSAVETVDIDNPMNKLYVASA